MLVFNLLANVDISSYAKVLYLANIGTSSSDLAGLGFAYVLSKLLTPSVFSVCFAIPICLSESFWYGWYFSLPSYLKSKSALRFSFLAAAAFPIAPYSSSVGIVMLAIGWPVITSLGVNEFGILSISDGKFSAWALNESPTLLNRLPSFPSSRNRVNKNSLRPP